MPDAICDPLKEIWRHVRLNYRTQKDAAAALGVSRAYLSMVVNGKKPPSQAILDAVGIEKRTVTVYVRKDESACEALSEGKGQG